MPNSSQLPDLGGAARPDRPQRDRGGRWLPRHFTRDVSPIYRLAKNDPFDRDIRARGARMSMDVLPRPRAPVRTLAQMEPVVQGVLMALYECRTCVACAAAVAGAADDEQPRQ